MKTKNLLWAALSMTAALVMTACSNDDNDMTEAPVAPSTSKIIPYTVTVGSGDATTRATVKDDPEDRQLYFATGDKLYITGTDIQGVLDLQDGDDGKASGATFSGDLEYTGGGSPAADLQLTATLVSAQQTVGTQVSVDDAGAVTVNYPTTAYCADVATAVQEYSRLTGTCEYSQKAFTLTQQTAFLNFEITVTGGTSGTTLPAKFINNGATLATANVTTVSDGGVKAKFVLPVAAGTTLSSATVKLGGKQITETISNATLTGKVYNVKKTMSAVTLADVFTDDAVVTVKVNTANSQWLGATGTYTSGTYATTGIGSFSPSSVSMTKDGSNLVATVTSPFNTYTVTFNTTNNTYMEDATSATSPLGMTELQSITINGVDITSTLTKVTPETITWDDTYVFGQQHVRINNNDKGPFTYEGVSVTFTGSGVSSYLDINEKYLFVHGSQGGEFTFTAPSGKQFTKIVITDNAGVTLTDYGGWKKNAAVKTATWSGTPSNTVTLGSSSNITFNELKSIVFTLQ